MKYRTKHGVLIPPWRSRKRPSPVTFELVLVGKIPSKKNRQRASFNYSWAFGQIRSWFRRQESDTIKLHECMKFVASLIKNIHPYIYKPKELVEWEEIAKAELVKQAATCREWYAEQGLSFPLTECSIVIRHYWADEYQRDNSNREQTLHDILKDAGIIVDDNYKCLFKISSEADCYKDEILDHITSIQITAYSW